MRSAMEAEQAGESRFPSNSDLAELLSAEADKAAYRSPGHCAGRVERLSFGRERPPSLFTMVDRFAI